MKPLWKRHAEEAAAALFDALRAERSDKNRMLLRNVLVHLGDALRAYDDDNDRARAQRPCIVIPFPKAGGEPVWN